jgi:hypothetical protein
VARLWLKSDREDSRLAKVFLRAFDVRTLQGTGSVAAPTENEALSVTRLDAPVVLAFSNGERAQVRATDEHLRHKRYQRQWLRTDD